MSVYGYLHTMALPDLLQWASVNKKNGILELERNKICRRITFREGRIAACSSDDPPSRMGQFLLSRGKISQAQLHEALNQQQKSGQNLGLILQSIGAITREELDRQVAAKAEENIFGLFDWPDAVFRFYEDQGQDPYIIEVDLSVDDVLLRGVQRLDELQRIRATFRHSGMVLGTTAKAVPAGVTASALARKILEAVNGTRTLAEILLHARASEFLVAKFLFTLYRGGYVTLTEERPRDPEVNTILDMNELEVDLAGIASGVQESSDSSTAVSSVAPDTSDPVVQLLANGEYGAALDIVNARYRARPGDNHLRQLILKAESGYLETVRAHKLTGNKIPVPLAATERAESKLQPAELFLLSMLDGKTSIQSLVWVAPLREVDLLRALEHMIELNLIELREEAQGSGEPQEADTPSPHWSPI